MRTDEEIEQIQKELIDEVTYRFEEDLSEIVEPFKSDYIKNKDKIIKLTALVYRENIQTMPANFVMSIIQDILK